MEIKTNVPQKLSQVLGIESDFVVVAERYSRKLAMQNISLGVMGVLMSFSILYSFVTNSWLTVFSFENLFLIIFFILLFLLSVAFAFYGLKFGIGLLRSGIYFASNSKKIFRSMCDVVTEIEWKDVIRADVYGSTVVLTCKNTKPIKSMIPASGTYCLSMVNIGNAEKIGEICKRRMKENSAQVLG
ncbi:MAG: hypothetical protein PHW52_01050 [Candidatus Pacebacteria bacterium]|nr:hypothetical protein [Candidatus Paceibacterota bacterium]